MKRPRWRIITVIATVVIVVFLLSFDRDLPAAIFTASIESALSKDSLITTIESASPRWFGVHLKGVTARGKSPLLNLTAEESNVLCSPWQLLRGVYDCSLEANVYQGKISLLANFNPDSKNTEGQMHLSGSVDDLQLNQHLLVRGFGVESGLLTLHNIAITTKDENIEGNVSVKLANFSKPTTTAMSPRLTGIPVPFEVPPLSVTTATADINAQGGSIAVTNLAAQSSLGNLSGILNFTNGKLVSFNLTYAASEEGRKVLAQYFQFICPRGLFDSSPSVTFSMGQSGNFTCLKSQ